MQIPVKVCAPEVFNIPEMLYKPQTIIAAIQFPNVKRRGESILKEWSTLLTKEMKAKSPRI